jgi:hypothetical protein
MCFLKTMFCEHDLVYVDACVSMLRHAMGASMHATVGSTIKLRRRMPLC